MRPAAVVAVCMLAVAFGGCERRGNLKTARDFRPPPAPKVENPIYDPYAAPGQTRAVWRPAVIDRRDTVIAPGRVEDEGAPRRLRPPGIF